MIQVPKGYFATHCCECQHEFGIRPSLAMRNGINSGHATCPNCKAFLHVMILEGNQAMTETWDKYLQRTTHGPSLIEQRMD